MFLKTQVMFYFKPTTIFPCLLPMPQMLPPQRLSLGECKRKQLMMALGTLEDLTKGKAFGSGFLMIVDFVRCVYLLNSI